MSLAVQPGRRGVVPKAVSDNPSVTAAVDYAESKYTAERMLAYASQHLRLPVTIVRIGQICGVVESPGLWNPKEWIPRPIRSGMALLAIPDSLGQYDPDAADVDWIPVDILANMLVDIIFQRPSAPQTLQVYNLVNPLSISWQRLVPAIVEGLNDVQVTGSVSIKRTPPPVDVFSRDDWLKKLREAAQDTLDPAQHGGERHTDTIPALGLLDFYEEKLADKVLPQWAIGYLGEPFTERPRRDQYGRHDQMDPFMVQE